MFDAVPQTTNMVLFKRLGSGINRIRFDRVYRHRETTAMGSLDGALQVVGLGIKPATRASQHYLHMPHR